MSNDIESKLSIFGDKCEINDLINRSVGVGPWYFEDTVRVSLSDRDIRYFDLHQLIPVPPKHRWCGFGEPKTDSRRVRLNKHIDAVSELRDWQGKKWGSTYVLCDEPPTWRSGVATYSFWSGWDPPLAAVRSISKIYRACTFIISFGGEGDLVGRAIFREGKKLEVFFASDSDAPRYADEDNGPTVDEEQMGDRWRGLMLNSHAKFVKQYQAEPISVKDDYATQYAAFTKREAKRMAAGMKKKTEQ